MRGAFTKVTLCGALKCEVDSWSPDPSPLPQRLCGLSTGAPRTAYSGAQTHAARADQGARPEKAERCEPHWHLASNAQCGSK